VMAARNYKRLIAYACVSSSGVIAIGLSVGKAAAYGVVLYVVSNAFVKALLFLTAGRLRGVYGSNQVSALSGVIRVLPFSGLLFAVGTFALLGFPPFGSFMAEMLILSGIVQAGNLIAFALMCTMLTIIFVATGRSIFPMLWGASPANAGLRPLDLAPLGPKTPRRLALVETWVTALPKLGFVTALVLLGVYTPAPISALLLAVAQSIGGS
jgi:hydrogenase-4 component F